MTVISITRAAKCKDCIFMKAKYNGKAKFHICSNELSNLHQKQVTLKTLVCDEWKLS